MKHVPEGDLYLRLAGDLSIAASEEASNVFGHIPVFFAAKTPLQRGTNKALPESLNNEPK